MISISGIEKQRELEKLPYFNKQTAGILIGKTGRNLDKKIEQLVKKQYLIRLRNGLYASQPYFLAESNKETYYEYLANILRYPSYLSLEYVLSLCSLIPEGEFAFTSITQKTSRSYQNEFGIFIYRSIKPELFTGYKKKQFGQLNIAIASCAKALFDYLYLKENISSDLEYEIKEGLRINWFNFSQEDREEFKKYVRLYRCPKMKKIAEIMERTVFK